MMIRILGRLLVSLFLLALMSLFTFWLLAATPGTFFDGLKLNPQISGETIALYERLYRLDDPLLVRWFAWIGNVARGEFGYSFYYNVPVADLLGPRLGNSFLLSVSSFLFTWLLAIPLGVWAALNHGRILDKMLTGLCLFFYSMPGFFVAMLLLCAASFVDALPLGGMRSAAYDDLGYFAKLGDVARHLVIPTIALSLASMASLQRLMRANMLVALAQPFVTAARARGVARPRLVYVHALRNAFNPMVTLLGYEFGALLSGAALIEIVTSWPGLGTLMLTAVRAKDVYVVMASMLMGGLMLLVGNLIADIMLLKLDPRIKGAGHERS